jgi:hypothetical protein
MCDPNNMATGNRNSEAGDLISMTPNQIRAWIDARVAERVGRPKPEWNVGSMSREEFRAFNLESYRAMIELTSLLADLNAASPNARSALEGMSDFFWSALESKTSRAHEASARRAARVSALPNTLTDEQWEAIKMAYNGRCAYCGRRTTKLEKDHVLPVSRGGGTVSANIVPACTRCNRHKSAGQPVRLPPCRLMF